MCKMIMCFKEISSKFGIETLIVSDLTLSSSSILYLNLSLILNILVVTNNTNKDDLQLFYL